MTGILLILLLVAIAWFWLDSSRARELAVGICREASQRYGVQFLDETVELRRLGLRWPNEGLRLRRVYHFAFSRDGVERLTGNLALVGINLEYLDFDFSIIDVNQPQKPEAGNIIPIDKRFR